MTDWKKFMDESDRYAAGLSDIAHQVFPVDSYVSVYSDKEYPNIYHLYYPVRTKGASVWMHLIAGSERALLIDTGFGIGNLKGLVRCLTDKPLDVVNTHYHGDHSAGDGWFDRVYIHEYDVPYLKVSMNQQNSAGLMSGKSDIKQEDSAPKHDIEIIPVKDSHVFTLGKDHQVEVIHMPGHAPGGCMLLDHATGLLFSGDAVLFTPTLIIDRFNNDWHPEMMTVTAFRDALANALPRLQNVRKLYTGHSVQGIGPEYLTDMLACCNAVIEHPERHELYDYADDPGQRQIMCTGKAMIVYTDNRIR